MKTAFNTLFARSSLLFFGLVAFQSFSFAQSEEVQSPAESKAFLRKYAISLCGIALRGIKSPTDLKVPVDAYLYQKSLVNQTLTFGFIQNFFSKESPLKRETVIAEIKGWAEESGNPQDLKNFLIANQIAFGLSEKQINSFFTRPQPEDMADYFVSIPPPSFQRRTSPQEFFENNALSSQNLHYYLKNFLIEYQRFIPWHEDIQKIIAVLDGIILGGGRNTPGELQEISKNNQGLKSYMKMILKRDEGLRQDAFHFYAKVNELPLTPKTATYFDLSPHDIYTMALDVTHGDVPQAIRILGIYGHDDISNELFTANRLSAGYVWEETIALDMLRPDPLSVFYSPGSIPGLNLSEDLLKEINTLNQRSIALTGNPLPPLAMRSGYYHFYGGAFLAGELIRRNATRIGPFDAQLFVSESMGFAYKAIANEYEYIDVDQKRIRSFRDTYHRYPNLNEINLQKANAKQDDLNALIIQLEFNELQLKITSQQHRRGAEWATQELEKFFKNQRKLMP